MTTNPYMKLWNHGQHQRLVDNMLIHSIKTWGYDIHYIPRDTTNLDDLLGEDPASAFRKATKFEIYIKNIDGYAGDGQFFQKFGLEVRQSMTFYVAKRRFYQASSNKLSMENGWTYQLEDANLTGQESAAYVLDEEDENVFQIDFPKPREGDLIYFPLTSPKRIFEIKFCDDDEIFWPTGISPVFTVHCEVFEYSHEEFDTGVAEIDNLANSFSGNMLDFKYTLEDGSGALLNEDGSPLILESYTLEVNDPTANNSLIRSLATDVVDWSDMSPFVKRDGAGKW